MLRQIIDLNPIEPARIGFRAARGAKFQCVFLFRNLDASAQPALTVVPANPQIVFRPRSTQGSWGYDLEVVDAPNGLAQIEIDGAFFNDPRGFTVEMYSRDSVGVPLEMFAFGQMRLTGDAYRHVGPLGPMTLPTGPSGPAGPAGPIGPAGVTGAAGIRGSMWFTGHGGPTILGGVEGDMYLDVDTGDVWRWVVPMATWERVP
jgi:hypothetical protein